MLVLIKSLEPSISGQAQGSPEWLQPTYNLEIQLSQLIGDYYARKQDGRDNLWILKPWNMARTIENREALDFPECLAPAISSLRAL